MSNECVLLPAMPDTVLNTDTVQTESRATRRVPVMRQVKVRASDGWEFVGLCTDVNLSGVGLETDHILKVGQRLEVEVHCRSGELIRIPMMVIYRMDRHYGLTTLSSPETVLELLPEQA